ncbi:uncharacterized protein METZ01_LOCUS255606, partial [marine metagenome]
MKVCLAERSCTFSAINEEPPFKTVASRQQNCLELLRLEGRSIAI